MEPGGQDLAAFEFVRRVPKTLEGGFNAEEFLETNKAHLQTAPEVLDLAMMLETQALDLYLAVCGPERPAPNQGGLVRHRRGREGAPGQPGAAAGRKSAAAGLSRMAITVMEVLKRLPRTNCGDCGQSTCLAFATQVIKEGEDLGKCPYLTGRGLIWGRRSGPSSRPASAGAGSPWPSPWRSCRKKWRRWISPPWPPGLGADYGEEAGRPYLSLLYFGHCLQVFKDELRYPPGVPGDPWDAILLYNYIASQGQEPRAGRWIAYNSLPNSVSKAKTLARLEREVAAHFAGQAAGSNSGPSNWGRTGGGGRRRRRPGRLSAAAPGAAAAALLGRRPEEGFEAQCRFLFDASVTDYLDLEAMLFLVEHLLARLMACGFFEGRAGGVHSPARSSNSPPIPL